MTAKKKRQLWEALRTGVQLAFFVLAPSIYHVCFAAVKNTVSLLGRGVPLEWNSFVVQLLTLLAVTIVFGRIFCGWACSFGALNDWLYRLAAPLRKKMKRKRTDRREQTERILERVLEWMKYVVLAGILVLCFLQQGDKVTAYSPWTVFSLIRSGRLDPGANGWGLALLAVLAVGMCLQERFFCRFLCPMGAIFSILPQVSFLRLKRHADNCPSHCGACRKACPVDLMVEDDSPRMGECIRCGRCKHICPRGNLSEGLSS